MRALIICFLISSGILVSVKSQGQNLKESAASKSDTVVTSGIRFSSSTASDYILKLVRKERLWRNPEDTLRLSLSRLLDHTREPFDSVRTRLVEYPFAPVEIKSSTFVLHDTLPLRWLDKASFIIDTFLLDKDPVIRQKTIVMRVIDPLSVPFAIIPPEKQEQIEALLQVKDTILTEFIDTAYIRSKNIEIYRIRKNAIVPSLSYPTKGISATFLEDSSKIMISKSLPVLMADKRSPFYILPGKQMPDSLQAAVETLLSFAWERDSLPIFLGDASGGRTAFWLTSGRDELYRHWVKNSKNDSITIWMGNPSKYDILLILEEEINVERPEKKRVDDIPIISAEPSRSLVKLQALKEIPIYWDYGFSGSFSLNQNYLSNWARGGESSLASIIDMSSNADYHNKESKVKWSSSGRMRYGTVRTKEKGSRKNADLIELNSQYNTVLREKLDFSSVFYMKTQLAKGYKYPNDSVPVSRFLNPGTFTIGVGIEYKPDKNTSFNVSPLSYKNTFVLDTANINQTLHGIEKHKRSRQEMGGQLVFKNSLTILNGLDITNSVRLFSGYLDKPQNVDIDWEINLEKQISWYFKVRMNLHLIYDDDIKFPVQDGSDRKVAKAQFNQFMGLTLSFRI